MEVLLLILVIFALLFVVGGFFLKVLWIVAVVFAILWLIGWVANGPRRRRL